MLSFLAFVLQLATAYAAASSVQSLATASSAVPASFSIPTDTQVAPLAVLGLPANFTFPPLDKPEVIDGVAQVGSMALPAGSTASAIPSTRGRNSTTIQFTNSTTSTVTGVSNSKTNSTLPFKQASAADDSYWLANIEHGSHPDAPSGYQWFRNVMDFGAAGDGVTDDTAAINNAVSAGPRCTPANAQCNSSSVLGALVYFPAGTYLISAPIFLDFYTQAVGNPNDRPVIKGSSDFQGIALIDTDFYIPDENGEEWYQNQNNFYRQVRNFVLDLTGMTSVPTGASGLPTGMHWQVAQATSLQNIEFLMTQGGTQQGIFMENGSGGFMSDIVFQFGAIGMRIGSQQFTMRNLVFNNCVTGIQTIWDWGWTFQNLQFNSIGIAIDARGGPNTGPDGQPFGSMSIIDSVFNSVNIVVFLAGSDPTAQLPQILIDNVNIENLPGSTNVVETAGGQVIFSVSEAGVIQSWARGKRYTTITDDGSESNYATAASLTPTPNKPAGLLDGSGMFFTQSKPQYEDLSVGDFLSVRDVGATGNGATDDTAAINSALQQAASSNRVCFFPMGIYIVTDTVLIPTGSRVVGETWSQIMASGSNFADAANPHVVVQVGNAGDVGSVEISDLLFTVRGGTAGAVLMEWNIQASSQGSAAMWDAHFRVGGAVGSDLQSADCPKLTGSVNPACIAASLLLHVVPGASAYIENVWAWVSDHDIDTPEQTQLDVYSGRGILIETQEPSWLYGSAAEHSVLYQYEITNAANIFLGFMQTETPYYQPTPLAPAPFTDALVFTDDPQFDLCGSDPSNCARAWALRIINSTDVYVYGAGFYSFFQDYDQTCVNSGAETCQDALIDISFSERLFIYDVVTIGAQQIVSPEGGVVVAQKDTQFFFVATVIAYLALAVDGANQGGSPPGEGQASNVYVPPSIWSSSVPSVACIPPCTLILPPFPLQTPTTISWPPLATSLLSSFDGTTHTIETTIDVPPFVITQVPFWPVTIPDASNPSVVFAPTQSIIPPSFTITLPGDETLPPVINLNYTAIAASSLAGKPPPIPSDTPTPTFFSTSHVVTVQPMATVTTVMPDRTTYVPPLVWTTGTPIASGDCGQDSSDSGCGFPICPDFGCAIPFAAGPLALCGLFACDGGCGIGFCGGGCGLFGCGPGCGSLGGCIIGGGGGGIPPPGSPGGEPEPTSSCATETATVCTETISSYSDTVSSTWSTITETDCDTTTGCDVTATTTTTTQDCDCAACMLYTGPTWGAFTNEPMPTLPFTTPPGDTTVTITITPTSTSVGEPSVSYVPVGCYSDSDDRTLSEEIQDSDQMTVEECSILCGFDQFNFFGVEFGTECWCGDTINPSATREPDPTTVCTMACGGDPHETCGGTWAINVYQVGSATPTPANVPGYQYMGCFSDANDRTLNGANTADSMLTDEGCVDFCEDNGYTWFGTEDSTECWCGNGISNGGQMISSTSCDQPCGGDGSELCGGTWAINVWGPTPTPTQPPPPPQPSLAVEIAISDLEEPTGLDSVDWVIYNTVPGQTLDLCDSSAVFAQSTDNVVASDDPPFPPSLGPFKGQGISGCQYTAGSSNTDPGSMSCPGVSGIVCEKDPNYGNVQSCVGPGASEVAVILCQW